MDEETEIKFYELCDLFQREIHELCDCCLWRKCVTLEIGLKSEPSAYESFKLSLVKTELIRRRIVFKTEFLGGPCFCNVS